jgi:hypothetical protein
MAGFFLCPNPANLGAPGANQQQQSLVTQAVTKTKQPTTKNKKTV